MINGILSKNVGKPDRFWKPVRFFPPNLEKIRLMINENMIDKGRTHRFAPTDVMITDN